MSVGPLLSGKLLVRPLLTEKLLVRPLVTEKLSVKPLLTDKLLGRTKKEIFLVDLLIYEGKKVKWPIQSTVIRGIVIVQGRYPLQLYGNLFRNIS